MKHNHDHVDPYRCYLYGPTPGGCRNEVAAIDSRIFSHYGPAEAKMIESELGRLSRAFRTEWQNATAYASPSATWRDESLAEVRHSSLSRFVTRLHVFERAAFATTPGGPGSAGRYLGFVCLRPPGSMRAKELRKKHLGFRYVIEADLVRPRHMYRPRYHLLQTTTSAPRMGVLPFLSTVFLAPRVGVESSTCVHLAVSQALHLVTGRFGSKPISQREFETHLWRLKPSSSIEQVARAGVSLDEAKTVVEKYCRAGGYIADISPLAGHGFKDHEVMREAHRILTDTLANGLPVIMMVNHRHLHPELDRNEPHAALIFGMRLLHSGHELPFAWSEAEGKMLREDFAELPGIFVGHDSISGPYSEWTAEQIISAAYACPPSGIDPQINGVRFLALGPRGMKMGVHAARRLAQKLAYRFYLQNPALFTRYARRHNGSKTLQENSTSDPLAWRFVTRMIPIAEVERRYFPDLWGKRANIQQRARRHRNLLLKSFAPDSSVGYCWAVELLLPVYCRKQLKGSLTNRALLVFFWRISDDGEGPRMTLVLQPDDTYAAQDV